MSFLKHLNKRSTKIFDKIIELNVSKIDNTEGFMPLHIDTEFETDNGTAYSIAHYYEQNGDLMADPIMKLWKCKTTGLVYPFYYGLDSLAIYQNTVFFENGKPHTFIRNRQAEQTLFANSWLMNIKHQQKL